MKTNPDDSIAGFGSSNPHVNDGSKGLTKREYFATNAPECVFQDKLTVGDCKKIFNDENYHRIPNYEMLLKAKLAVRYADALIEELNRGNKK